MSETNAAATGGAPRLTRGQAFARGTRQNSEGLAYLIAGAMPWLVETFVPMPVPPEVVNLGTALLTGLAVRVREGLRG